MCKRNIDCLPPVQAPTGDQDHRLGVRLTWSWTCDLLVFGMMLQTTEPPGQGSLSSYLRILRAQSLAPSPNSHSFSEFIPSPAFHCHLSANSSQKHTFSPKCSSKLKTCKPNHLFGMTIWVPDRPFRLKMSKTELLIFPASLPHPLPSTHNGPSLTATAFSQWWPLYSPSYSSQNIMRIIFLLIEAKFTENKIHHFNHFKGHYSEVLVHSTVWKHHHNLIP